jgi:prepilin-type N-terminal cleavage/methylation domain-containing protein
MKKRHAFTLVEMLVVIAIIGIIAALVVNMNSGAQTAKRNAVVNADKSALTMLISSYQSKLNFYPPDNGNLANSNVANYTLYYDGWAATNPLLYELTGATNNPVGNPGYIQLFDGNTIDTGSFNNMYGRSAVNNANTDEPHNFFTPGPQPREYTNYTTNVPQYVLKGLLVPVPYSPRDLPTAYNFWHYDASSPNRHNLSSYDLWAEYTTSGTNITTNGNW